MDKKPKYEVYTDMSNEWRWRLRAPNGRIIAESGEGYCDKRNCLNGITFVEKYLNAKIVEL